MKRLFRLLALPYLYKQLQKKYKALEEDHKELSLQLRIRKSSLKSIHTELFLLKKELQHDVEQFQLNDTITPNASKS